MMDRDGSIISGDVNVTAGHFVNEKSAANNANDIINNGFGHGSTKYEKFRPNYTKEAIDLMMKEITTNLPPECSTLKYNVLELGAGTGKTTEELAPRLPKNIRYLATEPSENFFKILESKSLPVETKMAKADNIPLEDNTVQNIVCGQCFHWFSDEKSLQEIQRVLVPGGKLILMWKIEKQGEGWSGEAHKQTEILYAKAEELRTNYYFDFIWRDNIDASPLFYLSQRLQITKKESDWSVDKFLAYVATLSVYNRMSVDERQRTMNKIREAILAWPSPRANPDKLDLDFISDVFFYVSQKKPLIAKSLDNEE